MNKEMLIGQMQQEIQRPINHQPQLPVSIAHNKLSSLVPFAGISLIRFNGSRLHGLSHMALRQVEHQYKKAQLMVQGLYYVYLTK